MNAPVAKPRRLTGGKFQTPHHTGPEPDADTVRVMIVDDSLTVRTILKRIVESDCEMSVVATASSAERAISLLKTVTADVVLLDLEMPGIGGLEALPAMLEAGQDAQVLVVSALTEDGAEATMKALSMGAADTMLKPRPGGFNDEYRSLLLGKIRALGGKDGPASERETVSESSNPTVSARDLGRKQPEVIAIGASTGGIHALNRMLPDLPSDFALPILITQHLPASFIPVFARQIEMISGRPTIIAEEGTTIMQGTIAIAPGHGHMVLRKVGGGLVARTASEPARSGCTPSVDPMFTSLAAACDGHVLGILLSGMGRDGFEGAKDLVAAGGTIFAQDSETSAVWGMPGAVAREGLASLVADPAKLRDTMVDFAMPAVNA